jgi:hypothetical protein
MPRKEHKYHFIYKITNTKNQKYYIGMHSTNNLNDGYFGGGVKIRNSIRKHGKDVHIIEVLEYLSERKLLVIREKEIINEDLLKDPLCLNLALGGYGGCTPGVTWTSEIQKKLNKRGYERMRYLWENDKEWAERTRRNLSNSMGKKIEEGKFKRFDWNGKKHKLETIQKMKEADRTGIKNSQFGTCWITNGFENKKIKKDDLEKFLSKNFGWKKGRKQK